MVNTKWNNGNLEKSSLETTKPWIKWLQKWTSWWKRNWNLKGCWWTWITRWRSWIKSWSLKVRQWIRFTSNSKK